MKKRAIFPSEITRKLREVEYITSRRSWPEDRTAHLFNGQKGGRVPVRDRITSNATLLLSSAEHDALSAEGSLPHAEPPATAAATSPSAGFSSKRYQEKAMSSLRALTRSQHSGDNRKKYTEDFILRPLQCFLFK